MLSRISNPYKIKTRPTPMNRPRLLPPLLVAQKACGLLINPVRLPLASLGRHQQPCLFARRLLLATPFPRMSCRRFRCEAPPPKRLATAVSEPDPLLLLSGESLSNDCASAS